MALNTHIGFDEVFAVHPHWEGHLLLSKIDNKLVFKERHSTGTYERHENILFVFWDAYPPEKFILQGDAFVHETLLTTRRGETFFFGPKSTTPSSPIWHNNAIRVAAVTDAVSSDFYFPLWHRYYGTLFGPQNLHVICFDGDDRSFVNCSLGSIDYVTAFNNVKRAKYVSEKVNRLLDSYDFVIRCDVDEFIIANPLLYRDLNHYIEELSVPNVTTFGYNVIQAENEPNLDLDVGILATQRHYAFAADALCKTAIVSSATQWGAGFHASSHPPQFNELYMFHLKLADLDLQMKIGASVAHVANEKSFYEYHTRAKELFQAQARAYFSRPAEKGYDRFQVRKFFDTYLERINFNNGMYGVDKFHQDQTLLEIPKEFIGKL